MRLPIHQIDAFSNRVFGGNPAAVCPLETWLDDATMQSIGLENNLSETAFFVRRAGAGGAASPEFDLRWFTPVQEVDLCGHATLASAFVVFGKLIPDATAVTFHTKSGALRVTKDGDLLVMRLPRWAPVACTPPDALWRGMKARPAAVLLSRDYLAIYETEEEVLALDPIMEDLMHLGAQGVIATAPATEQGRAAEPWRTPDFVSRYFVPSAGIPEDPVTGSAHCTLVPYWSERLGKKSLHALQVSKRGGELFCDDAGDAVIVSGRAVAYLEGTIDI